MRNLIISSCRLSLLALALVTAAIGCGDADGSVADNFSAEELDAPTSSDPAANRAPGALGQVIAITPIRREKAPLLAELMDGSPSKSRADLDVDPNSASHVHEASAILIDADAATTDELSSYASLLRGARLAGVPVVIENARDREKVTSVLGIGLSAAVIYAAPNATGQHFDVRAFGDFKGEEIEIESSTRLRSTSNEPLDAAPMPEADFATDPPARVEKSEMVQTALPEAGELFGEIHGLLANHRRNMLTQIVAEPMPEGTFRSYNVTYPSYQWSCGAGQTSTIDRNYTVTLLASNAPEGKYVVFTGNGTQYSPGPLEWNSGNNRGYFQELLQHSLKPMDPGLATYDHRPKTANSSSTFTTSTGFSAGTEVSASGPSTSFTFDTSEQATQSLNDFDVIDYSAGTVFRWDYSLASVSGHPYNDWTDLHNDMWGGLYGLPNLAKSTLAAEYEGIYSANIENQSMVQMFTQNGQRVRHTWVSADYGLIEEIKTTSCSKILQDFTVVNLGSVNVPKLGTIPWAETFDQGIASSVWTTVNEGITDSSPMWVVATAGFSGAAAAETGSAFDYPQTGDGAIDMRGTYLWAPRTAFGQGSLTAKIYAGDPDGFGLMYAMNADGSSYYRVMFDKALSVARLVRVDNGVFTELAVDTNYMPPQNTWMTVRVEREGTTHRVLVNDQLVLAVQGETTLPWGSIGLFSWGMGNVRFDDVKIEWL